MRGQNVVIIGSYREPAGDSGAAFRPAMGALASQEFFHGIPLSGWNQAAISEYLQTCGIAEPPAVLVRTVLDRTEGNPLFVAEVANLLKHEGLLNIAAIEDAGAWEKHIPQKVRLAILGQVQRLSAPCQEAMFLAALAGREFESAILHQTIQMTEATVEQILEEAIAHGIITGNAEKPGLYKFTHALIQEVVLGQIPAPRTSALHLRIGKVLERHYARDLEAHAGELARHFDRAGPEEVKHAVHYYRLAGECALRMHGFEDALEQLGRALRLGEGTGSAQDTARLLFGLAQSLHGVGRYKEAIETYTRAFDLFEQSGDIDNAVRIMEQPLILAEKGAEAMGLLERAIVLAGPGTLRAEALGGKYGLAVYHATGDYQKAASLFDRALHAARESGDRPQELAALMNRGRIECDELHFQEAHRLEEESTRLAQEYKDVWVEMVSLSSDVQSLLGLGRLADAEKLTDRIKALGEGRGVHIRKLTTVNSGFRFSVQRQKGSLTAAHEINEKAVAQGQVPYAIWNLADRALLDFEQGDRIHGAQLLQKVEEQAHLADAYIVFHWEGWLIVLLSLIAWVTGETMRFESAESAVRVLLSRGGLRKSDLVHIHAGLGLTAVIRGDGEAARKHYAELAPFRGLVICPYQGIVADHLLALLAQTKGDNARARDHFSAAVAFCRERRLTLELAYTCRDYAQFLLGGGEIRDAALVASLCQEADLIARHSGLPRLIQRLEELQGRLIQSKPSPPAYPDSLSEREVDVLRLLAEGLSNALIGERLFISLHTVANHVQKILEKTGSANRTEAAIYAVRCGLTGIEKPHP
jgi:DNA-binding CsgD family transcriptional regulator